MTPERHDEILQELKLIHDMDDTEEGHVRADKLVMEFLPKDIREAYDRVHKWYA